jgi:predicted outer membrane protein
LSLPADAESKYKAALSKLEKLNGAAFDKAYMDDQVKDHEKSVNLFGHEATADVRGPALHGSTLCRRIRRPESGR